MLGSIKHNNNKFTVQLRTELHNEVGVQIYFGQYVVRKAVF